MGNITSGTQKQWVGSNSDEGTVFGLASTDKIAFLGGTPMARSTLSAASLATTVAVSTTTGAITSWGFSTSTQANGLVSLANEMRALLVALGFAG